MRRALYTAAEPLQDILLAEESRVRRMCMVHYLFSYKEVRERTHTHAHMCVCHKFAYISKTNKNQIRMVSYRERERMREGYRD